jgi:transcription antitermination factor NusG
LSFFNEQQLLKNNRARVHMGDHFQAVNWYAIQVRPRSEFFTANLLRNKGFDHLVPQYRSIRRWSDRKVELELPLFPGYIFCRFDPQTRFPIMSTAGVVRIVGSGKVPLPIEEHEMQAILHVNESCCRAEPHPFVAIGTKIRIEKGPLAGLEGIVSGCKNRHVIFSVGLLRRSISVPLDDTVGAMGTV